MASDKPLDSGLTTGERAIIGNALDMKLKSLLRAQQAQVSGSSLHKAYSLDIMEVRAILARFGGTI